MEELGSIKELGKDILMTPQEHKLAGSSAEGKYMDKFYTPVAIQMGYDIKEVDESRKMYKIFESFGFHWKGADKSEIESLYLSPLNLETGKTILDPKPVKRELRLKESSEDGLRWRTFYLDDGWRVLDKEINHL